LKNLKKIKVNKTIIAIPSSSNLDDAMMSERFGRCSYFCIYDSKNDTMDFVDNPAVDARGGAGFQAVEFLLNNGVGAVIVPRLGPNADGVLRRGNVDIFQGENIPIKELIEQWKKNTLTKI
jgi:predicted Fe-Mo cluster-binding NifX family protein